MMNTQEVSALLNKSGEQIRRYVKQGLLTATHSGRELLFDSDEVIKFAESRGIRVTQSQAPMLAGREVPQDDFFTELARAMRKAPPGVTLAFTHHQEASAA